jgi:hypothetical protein
VQDQAGITAYDCEVFAARDLRVTWGIHEGDALTVPDQCAPGDIYTLAPTAKPRALTLALGDCPRLLADGAQVDPLPLGAPVEVSGLLRLMATDGDVVDLVVLRIAGAVLALPLCPMRAGLGYALISIDISDARLKLVQTVQGCLASGTRIALADGSHHPIETLSPGALVLTRDHGAQPLRWRGHVTLRAHGSFAPVTFAPAALGNLGPLTVAPLQRIFLYQRGDRVLARRAEVLIQARYLADGQRATWREGGFITYHSLVFDAHQIVYAEGVPVESLLVSRATLASLPAGLAQDLRARFPRLDQSAHFAQAS